LHPVWSACGAYARLHEQGKADQAHASVLARYAVAQVSGDELRLGQTAAYETFYALSSLARRFPRRGSRNRLQWSIYSLFIKKGAATDRKAAVAAPTEAPDEVPVPPILPIKREWRQAVLEATGETITYARNQWQALRRYTEDGRLTIDNNVSERTLRHQAIGRKNWLFLGSAAAGPRAAVLCTILAGAKRQRIEPWCYVRELLLRLHADDPRLDEMLPDRWAAAHPEAVLAHRLDESRAKVARTRLRRAHRRARHQ